MRQMPQRAHDAVDAVVVEEVRHDDHQAAPQPHRGKVRQRPRQRGVARRPLFGQQLRDPQHRALARYALQHRRHVVADGEQADRVMLAERGRRQRQHRLHRRADARRRFDEHAARHVEQEINGQILPLLEHPHERLAEPRIDVPVDRAQVVARDIGLEVGEIGPLTARRGPLVGKPPALLRRRDPQREGVHPIEEGGIEQLFECRAGLQRHRSTPARRK